MFLLDACAHVFLMRILVLPLGQIGQGPLYANPDGAPALESCTIYMCRIGRCPNSRRPRKACRIANSVGGVLNGRGADLIIIDDPLKPEEALSRAQRRAANEWFDHTLYSRLNDKQQGAIVLIMHRLHEACPRA